MSNIEFLKTLTENNVLELVGIFSYGLRYLGWILIQGLVKLVDGLENAVSTIYNINNFFETKEVVHFLDNYKPVLWTIFAIALAFIGFQIMFQRKRDKGQIPVNILISITIIVGLPFLMTELNKATKLIVDNNIGTYESSAKEIVKGNLSDLYYLDSMGYKLSDKKNNISINNIMSIDINEKLDIGKISNDKAKEALKYKMIEDSSGNLNTQKLDKSFFSFLDEDYYRYNLNFMVVIGSLLVSIIAMFCSCLKIGRILIELAFNKILATVLAFSDIGTGKKLKMVVENILSMFAILISTSVLLKLYVVFTGWLNSPDVAIENQVVKLLVLGAGSWAVIDGPNIIERIFGIDAGIKSSWGAVVAGIEGAKMLGKGTRSMFSAGNKLYNGGKSAYSSMKDGFSKLKDNTNSKNVSEGSSNIKNNIDGKMSSNPNMKNNSDIKNNSNINSNKSNKDGNSILNKNSSETPNINNKNNMGVNKNGNSEKSNLNGGSSLNGKGQSSKINEKNNSNIGNGNNQSSLGEKEKLLKEAILKNQNGSATKGQGFDGAKDINNEKNNKFNKDINPNTNSMNKGYGQANKFNQNGVNGNKFNNSNIRRNNNSSQSRKLTIGDKSKFNIKNNNGGKK
ncbi:pLS20_p028 family conjugation system transmembrane protein [Clostridium perfringens]|uniref:pLS20_p028 family conjugation system transmembrane protein n=1 Tax=Clostridium perfringens TaxID=1502 RepID=UPI003BA8CE50